MRRKVAAVWVSLLIICSLIVIIIEIAPTVKAPITWYVDDVAGGTPAENFTSIQDAINTANPGDTIFVYNGSYFEHIVIDKTINLMGENTDSVKIDGNDSGVVVYVTADFVNITTLTVTGCGSSWRNSAIELNNAQNINIINSNISDNPCLGVDLNYAIGITLLNNTFSNNDNRGLYFYYADDVIMENNTVSNNGYMGISLHMSNNNRFYNNRISNNTDVGLYISQSLDNIIKNNYISNNTASGITVTAFSNDNVITDNYAVKNGNSGIRMGSSTNNMVSRNNVYSNWDGFFISNAMGNTISNNTFSNNRWIGVNIQGCNNNVFTNNVASNNQHLGFLIDKSLSAVSHFNTISNNVVNNNDWVGIYLYESENNTVTKNNVFGNDEGIRVYISNYNIISFNNVLSNNDGVTFESSYYNNLTDNNILDSDYGIMMWGSERNRVYNNKFINSKFRHVHSTDSSSHNNIWNDSNEMGNYWSDYTGLDDGSNGRTAGDGVGDTLIPHPFTNQGFGYFQLDNYPLIKNFTILKQGWNLISLPFIQEDGNLTKVLSSIEGYYDAIQWYDSSDSIDPWKHHKVGKPFGNDLSKLNETMGFWIDIIQPGGTIIVYNGTQPTSNQTIQLHPGWNMVGYPSLTNHNRTVGLNNLTFDTHVDAIQWFDAATKTWHFMDQDDFFVPGRGYWVHSKVEVEWEVPI